MEKMTATLVLALCACGNVEGLKSEDVFGLAPHPQVWLYGQVTSSSTGAPIPDVSIEAGGISTTSDRNGAYRLDGLGNGELQVSASVHGFRTSSMALNLRAGANARDIALEPQDCGRWSCGADEFCENEACVAGATLTGSVINACDGSGMDARVTIDGKSTCSSGQSGKAYFQLHNLRPGGPQTFSAGKVGFQAYSTQVTLVPGFNALDIIELTPIGGCGATPPEYVACTCTMTSCQ